jgi:hypothetical protein
MAEKDANSVTSSLRKANLDKRLLVSVFCIKLVVTGVRVVSCQWHTRVSAELECVPFISYYHRETNSILVLYTL